MNVLTEHMAVLYSYRHRTPRTKILYFFLNTTFGAPSIFDNNG